MSPAIYNNPYSVRIIGSNIPSGSSALIGTVADDTTLVIDTVSIYCESGIGFLSGTVSFYNASQGFVVMVGFDAADVAEGIFQVQRGRWVMVPGDELWVACADLGNSFALCASGYLLQGYTLPF